MSTSAEYLIEELAAPKGGGARYALVPTAHAPRGAKRRVITVPKQTVESIDRLASEYDDLLRRLADR